MRGLGVAELAPAVRVAARLDDVTGGVDGVEAMLGVGGEGAAKRPQLGGNGVAGLVRLVLEHRDLAVSVQLEVAVVRGRQLRNEDLEAGAVGGHPAAGEQRAPVMTVDGGEQICGAFDEADERAHREPHAALGEVAANAIERGEQRELLRDEPCQPIAGDLGALVRRRPRARCRAAAAAAAPARRAADDATTLVLLDDVELLLDDLVGHVERVAAAVEADVRAQLVGLDLVWCQKRIRVESQGFFPS